MPKQKKNPAADSRPSGTVTPERATDGTYQEDEDQERYKSVYKYLLSLTDLGITADDPQGKPNESSIAKQWGLEKNRIFVRRVLRSVYTDLYPKEVEPNAPVLTLRRLTQILASLQQYRLENRKPHLQSTSKPVPAILTRSEKHRALRKFSGLTVLERQELGLPAHAEEALLQQLVDTITDQTWGFRGEDIRHLYEQFIHYPVGPRGGNQSPSEEHQHNLIQAAIQICLQEHFDGLDEQLKQEKIEQLSRKVQREISRIEFQAGLKQSRPASGENAPAGSPPEYLTPSFLQRLTRAVVENEILTDEFPVYLKFFNAEKVRPLPLYFNQTTQEKIGVLNSRLFDKDQLEEDVRGLDRQYAYRVQVHFYIKLPQDYQTHLEGTEKAVIVQFGTRQLHFQEEITGVGSILSHITAAINRVLLWDIPELRGLMPVAQEIWLKNEIQGGSSHNPVWSNTLVRLCQRKAIDRSIQTGESYEIVANDYELAYGEYCGFDLMEVAANAALHARLRAIKQSGIDCQKYLHQLCYRVEELIALRRAKEALRSYPFSLKAMVGELHQTIFKQKYRFCKSKFEFQDLTPDQHWSLVAYEAHLAIAEAYLQEGLHRIAKCYLDTVEPHFQKFDLLFSGLMVARYHLCWFEYHYLTDLQDEQAMHPDRYKAVRTAVDSLDRAEKWLNLRVERYQKIKELPQTNFHPFFYLFSRIYACRAKLYIYYSSYMEKLADRWETLLQPIRLLEQARIYAGRDGNADSYAYWSAYQSWCYLMMAYLSSREPSSHPHFDRDTCLDWARRLIKHMKLCYSSTGEHCYQQIKDNGGKSTAYSEIVEETAETPTIRYYDAFGKTRVQVVPLIQELPHELVGKQRQEYDAGRNVLIMDTSNLKGSDEAGTKPIYLFGPYSSTLLFAIAMLALCEDYPDDQSLLQGINLALREFTRCWVFAQDGGRDHTQEDDATDDGKFIVFDRLFEDLKSAKNPEIRTCIDRDNDSAIRGLYPHRLTEFADLGKIFAAACMLLRAMALSAFPHLPQPALDVEPQILDREWQGIEELLKRLLENDDFCCQEYEPEQGHHGDQPNLLGQRRYNGHMSEHYKKIEGYFRQSKQDFQAGRLSFNRFTDCRNQVVTDLFQLIRNDS
ncbi:hypothetical protein BST81_01275 [Leptolyngbya sp. 'hensonii']|uniref:hypothetical protein n=1 Tax=Leptolyngbya sp. 'hensonii' TaxID=1922337 RepID=UPI00094FA165|nr:hypothetical protein [Leptolyngbya sp. 'hensonii']OLP20387.1 hypothetical protein BST81_01275 [Leptolyngbya sp. 'hensonii']